MTLQANAVGRALTADHRALVKRLIDLEVRRRHEVEAARTAATKRRYHLARGLVESGDAAATPPPHETPARLT
jgi:hypothetical protein